LLILTNQLTIFFIILQSHAKYKFFYAKTSDEAILLFMQHHIDVAFIDLYLHPIHGLEILKKLKSILPQADVVIISY